MDRHKGAAWTVMESAPLTHVVTFAQAVRVFTEEVAVEEIIPTMTMETIDLQLLFCSNYSMAPVFLRYIAFNLIVIGVTPVVYGFVCPTVTGIVALTCLAYPPPEKSKEGKEVKGTQHRSFHSYQRAEGAQKQGFVY